MTMILSWVPHLAVFGIDDLLYILAIAATAASTVASYQASETQKKTVKDQGEANAKATAMEAQRKAFELAENQRRKATEQRRFRASQAAQQAATGFRMDTGTALAISADTYTAQARELGDLQYNSDVEQRAYGFGAERYRSQAAAQASALGQQQTAGLISGISSAAGASFSVAQSRTSYADLQRSQQPYSIAGTNYQARPASARPNIYGA